jgi:hypothetical protein
VPIFLKSWCLNFLEPHGPVQACIGIDLHIFTFLGNIGVRSQQGKKSIFFSNISSPVWWWLNILLWVAKVLSLGLEEPECEGDQLR